MVAEVSSPQGAARGHHKGKECPLLPHGGTRKVKQDLEALSSALDALADRIMAYIHHTTQSNAL
jgi:hypothetical protein